MITKVSSFQKEPYYIPNVQSLNVDSPCINEELSSIIDRYEDEFLIRALGVKLFNEFRLAESNIESASIWSTFIHGEDYEYNGDTYQWKGVCDLLVKYIYCKYLEIDEFELTTVGVVKNDANNARSASYNKKYIRIWGEFLADYQGNINHSYSCPLVVERNRGFGLDYLMGQGYYYYNDYISSLWQYMSHKNELNNEHFTDFKFSIYETKNTFGF